MNWRFYLTITAVLAAFISGLYAVDWLFSSDNPQQITVAPSTETPLTITKEYSNTPHGVTETAVYAWPVYSNGWGVTEFTNYSVHVLKHENVWWDADRENFFPIPENEFNPAWEQETNYNPNVHGFTN